MVLQMGQSALGSWLSPRQSTCRAELRHASCFEVRRGYSRRPALYQECWQTGQVYSRCLPPSSVGRASCPNRQRNRVSKSSKFLGTTGWLKIKVLSGIILLTFTPIGENKEGRI